MRFAAAWVLLGALLSVGFAHGANWNDTRPPEDPRQAVLVIFSADQVGFGMVPLHDADAVHGTRVLPDGSFEVRFLAPDGTVSVVTQVQPPVSGTRVMTLAQANELLGARLHAAGIPVPPRVA